jgi:hypothetical protein
MNMKVCEKHLAMMRKAVDARGMTHLIHTGQENMEAALAEMEEGTACQCCTSVLCGVRFD